MDLTDRKTAEKFMGQYLQFGEKMRPDIAMIEVGLHVVVIRYIVSGPFSISNFVYSRQ